MPAATQITVTQLDLNRARCQALFSSGPQPSDAPTAGMIATAIGRARQQFGACDLARLRDLTRPHLPHPAAPIQRALRHMIAHDFVETMAILERIGDPVDYVARRLVRPKANEVPEFRPYSRDDPRVPLRRRRRSTRG